MRTNGMRLPVVLHEDAALELWYDKAVAAGNDVETYRNYEITYYRPEKEPETSEEREKYIRWEDNREIRDIK